MLADKSNRLCKLLVGKALRMAEDDSSCAFDLIVEKLAEVLHIHLALLCIHNGGCGIEADAFKAEIIDCLDNVGKLADTGGLDDDALGAVGFDDLGKCLAEISNERTADTSGVHLRYLNARLLEKSAVDADIAEFVFNNYQLFTRKGLADKLFYKSCLSRTEKA